MKTIPKLLTAMGLTFGLAASTLQGAIIIYTSFGAGQSYDTGVDRVVGNEAGASYEDAMPFTATMTGPLASITVPVFNVLAPSEINFSLNVNNGTVPGTALESWTLTGLPGLTTLSTMTSTSNPTLTAGVKYWLIASVTGTSTQDGWYLANSGSPTGFLYSSTGGATWGVPTGNTTICAFELDSAQPLITSVAVSGTNLVLDATNGLSGRTYYTLSSTNVALTPGQWTPIATNVLSANGSFTITATNAVNATIGQEYYILELQ
jgi:hypothetical protein